ncbi:MAG: hemolysin-type calcium-binding repeat family protein [Rhizobium sp.]|nr:hemolysin-type calcium-binding repeat family protein [Rhizobium sp.]
MKKVNIPEGHPGQYVVSQSNRDYILAKGFEIHDNVDTVAFVESNTFSGNYFHINGSVENQFFPVGVAMAFAGTESHVIVGKSGDISAFNTAISMGGANQVLVNNGHVESTINGIYAAGAGKNITNNGDIVSGTGMLITGEGKVTNNGEIDAGTAGIRWDDGSGTLTLGKNSDIESDSDTMGNGVGISRQNDAGVKSRTINDGEVTGANFSFSGLDGDETVINRGHMTGDVWLGNGNDTFDNRTGTLTGDVTGGVGSDTYIMGATQFVIVEQAADAGTDAIKSTVTLTLDAAWHIEDLHLLGKKNINGFGDSGDNHLFGNKGRNVLGGLEGTDQMTGGAGKDTFVFKTGGDGDSIMDFQNGVDKIDLSGWDTYTSFADIVAKNGLAFIDGNTHIIDFNGMGEELTIVGLKLGQLDKTDFIF